MSDTKYYYIKSIDKYISSTGGLYTDSELDYLYELEKEWKDSLPHYTFKELMEMFPEGKSAAKRGLKKEIRQYKDEIIKNNVAWEEYYNENICPISDFREQAELKEKSDRIHREIHNRYEGKIKATMFKLSHLEGKPATKGGVSEVDIEGVRHVSIENFYDGKLQKFGNKAKGLCPFHTENTPSFVIYLGQNSFYCYGCHEGGSVIDFLILKENKTFLQVVKELSTWEGIL